MNMLKEKLGKKPTTIFHLRAGSSFFLGWYPQNYIARIGVAERDTKSHNKCPWDISGISTRKNDFPLKVLGDGKKQVFFRPQVVFPWL